MEIPVTESSAVGLCRRTATQVASSLGFDEEDAGRAALIAAELATNLVKHAGEGVLHIHDFADSEGIGVEIIALDRGPGMVDMQQCLRDGYSTSGTAGNGLGAVMRMATTTDYYSLPPKGMAFVARVNARAQSAATIHSNALQISGLSKCYPGEIDNGDAWHISQATRTMFVADGLGHGLAAATAARLAVDTFKAYENEACVTIMERVHQALTTTRGAAVALARIDDAMHTVRYVGLGNIAGAVLSENTMRRMASQNGIAGHKAARISEFTYPYEQSPLIIMHSDGLSARWDMQGYPGLSTRHSAVIAGVLFRDHRRNNDDATIAVARSS